MRPMIFEIRTAPTLPYLLTAVKEIDLHNISVGYMQNLKTVS